VVRYLIIKPEKSVVLADMEILQRKEVMLGNPLEKRNKHI
jgi:hypothetical protein